ncbi:Methanogenesis regulatory protein FilR1 [uncultured archaeon]|nr:Methanogenesis regulatory protein FilR1 [uncultured archaeon]
MQACKRYDLAEGRIKAFTRSSIRAKVILCLKDGPKTAADLESMIGIRTSTILHSVKDMVEADLVVRTNNGYSLTNIGKIQALLLDDLVSCIVALDEHKDFWQSHDIGSIPPDLQKRIGMLIKSEVLKGDPVAILRTQEFFISELKKAKLIYGVSPIIVPGYAEAIAFAVGNGAEVNLILTDKILELVIKENRDVLVGLLASEKFRLFRIEDGIRVAFTVTDGILSLGLFRKDGGYDVSSDLNCKGPEALLWGRKLFDYYLHRSKPIENV